MWILLVVTLYGNHVELVIKEEPSHAVCERIASEVTEMINDRYVRHRCFQIEQPPPVNGHHDIPDSH